MMSSKSSGMGWLWAVYRNEANYISLFSDMRSIRLMVVIGCVDDREVPRTLKQHPAPVESPPRDFQGFASMRIGHGYDVHRFGEGDHITLGGVRIPHRFGLLAHSDGDVLLHALSDALLGAAALGDIGKHFPDTDPQFKGADSRALLRHVLVQVQAKGYVVGNVDATIIAQAPKMAPHIDSMRALIAADLQVELDQVNVKATTTEKLGFTGREEGIAVHAVALLVRA